MQRKKRLGEESLNWIKETKKSPPVTSVSKKGAKSKSKTKRLGVLKQYVSEEAEVKKIKRKKAPPLIPEESATIVKGKKEDITKKEIAPSRKKKVKEKEIPTPEKVKSITGEIIETAKKEVTKVTDTITKTFEYKGMNIKKGLNSVISASTHPIRTISSIDRKITMSVGKISLFDEKNLINNRIVKPLKSVDDSINRAVKKFLDSIL